MRWKCCGREANADDLFCPNCTDEDGVFDDDDDDADEDAIEGYDFDDDDDDADDDYADDTSVSQCEDCGEWAVFWNEYNAATQCHACGLAEENA